MFPNLILMLSLAVHAETPQFTILAERQCAPFEGVLFDKRATAEILSSYDMAAFACDSQVQYELSILGEHHRLEIESLRIEHKALTEEYGLFIEQKDKEIQALVKSLKKTSPRNKTWWFVGGIVVGSATTYGAYKAFNER
jgi:hypothetical protein